MPNVILIAAVTLFVVTIVALGATDYVLALIGAPVLATVAVLLSAAIVIAPLGVGSAPPTESGPHQ
jgi:hypothetical protein